MSGTVGWYALVFLAGIVLGILAIGVVLFAIFASSSSDLRLPLMAVGGFLTFALALGGLAALLSAFKLSEHPHALGLPEGSVRALIALVLVILFVAMAAYLFGNLGPDRDAAEVATAEGVTRGDLEKLPEHLSYAIVRVDGTDPERVDAKLFVTPAAATAAQQDLAKQIFTTIATVLVTIIGFYFGSRSSAERREPGPHEDAEEAAKEAAAARDAELVAAAALAEAEELSRTGGEDAERAHAAVRTAYQRAHEHAARAQLQALIAAMAHDGMTRKTALATAQAAAREAHEAAERARATLAPPKGDPDGA
jgi:hypothetical protein